MNVFIRALQPSDKLAVKRLFEDTWNFRKFLSPRDASTFAASLAEDAVCAEGYVRGVFAGDEPVALIAGRCALGSDPNILDLLITHPRFQRMGLGGKLLSGFEDWCASRNHLPLQTVSDSECQWKFYEKNGFALIDEKKTEVSGSDVVLYYFEKIPRPSVRSTAEIPVMPFTSRSRA
mgnify:CR=1 FL=1